MSVVTSEDRLKAFAARKSAEACVAALERWETDVDRPGADQIAIGNAWSRARFDGDFYLSPEPRLELPSTSLVFVQSRDGNTGAPNPSALAGGDTDKHVVYEGLSRAAADAVFAGAETIRGGDIVLSVWHPEMIALRRALGLPRHPVQIVASLRGLRLDQALMFNVPEVRVMIVTVPAVVEGMREALRARPWIETVVMSQPDDIAAAFRALRASGITRISAIGGRTVAAALIDAGLVQDLYLTTSAKIGGEPNTPFYPRPLDGQVVVQKHGTGEDTGVAFVHRRIQSGAPLPPPI